MRFSSNGTTFSTIIRGQPLAGEECVLVRARTVPGKSKGVDQKAHEEEAVAVAEAQAAAEALLTAARQEAEEIIAAARQQALEEAQAIRQQAWNEGYDAGRREAISKARVEANAMREQARAVLRQAEEVRRRTLEQLENEIVELAREIAEKIVFTQLTLDEETILAVAREAIELARNREEVILYVNPADEAIFQARRDELQRLLPPRAVLHIFTDASVGPGGCRVETPHTTIDASLESRWANLLRALGLNSTNKS